MVRISLKGGVWKNAEDEMLKAGVMKYGKNNWSRVASLLNRKTARECKARWFEWLDPAIKKTEWTREEEEKLLQLAKIFPAQWRTIAPMLNRTANQCIEHFTLLQDLALSGTGAGAESSSLAARKPAAGEIDPSPESKPARPDPVDMDDEDKEMLQEVRARLANTKGKKATRKAREKHLEEAQRLAQLQKLRELRAAGIESKVKVKKRANEIDYATEIPFQHAPPPGPFDTGADKAREEQLRAAAASSFIGAEVGKLDGERYQEREARERIKDAQRERVRKETALPELIQRLNAMNDPAQLRARAPLALPAPQTSAAQLEALARAGGLSAALAETARAAARGALVTGARGGVTDRAHLEKEVRAIAELNKAPPSAAAGMDDADDEEAAAQAAARAAALKTDFSGAVSARTKAAARTVAPLAQAAAAAAAVAANPAAAARAAGAGGVGGVVGAAGAAGARAKAPAPRSAAAAAAAAAEASRKRLRSMFAGLPEAEAEYQLVWPELPRLDARDSAAAAAAGPAGAGAGTGGVTALLHTATAGALAAAEARASAAAAAGGAGSISGDAEADAARAAAAAAYAAQRAAQARPAALQRGLPRPPRVNGAMGAGVEAALAGVAAAAAAAAAGASAESSNVLSALASGLATHTSAAAAATGPAASALAQAQALVRAETVALLQRDAAEVPLSVTAVAAPAAAPPGAGPAAAAGSAAATKAVPLPHPSALVAAAALRAHEAAAARASGPRPADELAPLLARAQAMVQAEAAAAAAAAAGVVTAAAAVGPVEVNQRAGLYCTAEDAAAAAAGEPMPSSVAAAAAANREGALLSAADVAAAHAPCGPDSLLFSPSDKAYALLSAIAAKPGDAAAAAAAAAAAEAQAVALLRSHEAALRARADKLEQRLGVTLGGYMSRLRAGEGEMKKLWAQAAQARVNAVCFESMFEKEKGSTVGARLARLRELVDKQKEVEAALQSEYVARIRDLEDAVQVQEQQVQAMAD